MTGAYVLHRAVSLTTAALFTALNGPGHLAPAWLAVVIALVYNLWMHTWVLVRYDRLHPV